MGASTSKGTSSRRRIARVAAGVAVGLLAGIGAPAHAAPSAPSSTAAHQAHAVTIQVHSAAMNKDVPVEVLVPKNTARPAPVLYLLNGAGGGEDEATWDARTNYRTYFADKNAYVVTPIGGGYSYYTDWERDDPKLGRNKWQTFLTKELPPVITARFNTTGVNGLAGISMAGTSVLNMAIAAPGLYKSVAAFSGCARTSDPIGQEYIRIVVQDRGQGNMTNMWGPLNGPGWRANDPYLNAAKLRGTKLYMTAGSGLPGRHEQLNDPSVEGDPLTLGDQAVVGGVIEAAVNQCTSQMAARLHQLHIPADIDQRSTGTHSWGYWQDDLKTTWPKMARDLA